MSKAKEDDEAEVKSEESKSEETSEEVKAEATESVATKAEASAGEEPEGEASSSDESSDDESSDDEPEEEVVQAKPAEKVAEPAPTPPAEVVDLGPEPPPEVDSPKMGLITAAFVVTAIVLIGLVVGTRELFHGIFRAEFQRKVGDSVSESLTQLRTTEQQRLGNYQWIDEQRGKVRIPTSRARELVLAKYAAMPIEKSAPAPVPTPEAPAPEAPAPEAPAPEAPAPEAPAPTPTAPPAPQAPRPTAPPAPRPVPAPPAPSPDPY